MALESKLESKLRALEGQADELSRSLSDPDVTADMERFRNLSRKYSEIEPIIARFREYGKAEEELKGARELLAAADDPEMRQMASDEVKTLEQKLEDDERSLTMMLLPSDPNDTKNIILEIRAGTGGDEATLFAAELFRMYCRYAEGRRWRVNTTGLSESGVGGIKEVIAIIEGDRVYSNLKYESGVHRVQRVPETEAQGRVHTSAVTVAVMPEADDVEIEIEDKDLKVDLYCSSGPGGQSVNTTQSAVRLTHLPTNLVVQCQDEKSQHKNKARALQVLRSRLFDLRLQEQQDAIAAERKGMVKTGDRSEKIRTYNFPQNRVTDHRLGFTTHDLPGFMNGDIVLLIEALAAHDQAERLRQEVQQA